MAHYLQCFVDWTKKKINHHINYTSKLFYFREKEIWWVALGQNIGFEINGKHQLFERPVLVIKKYSEDMCFVLPLSTQIKSPLPWYQLVFDVKGKPNSVNITQGRTISSKRMLRKIEVLDTQNYTKVIAEFKKQFV